MLINLNESLFSKWAKLEYSWSRDGEKRKLKNIEYADSTSIITSITSSGKVIAANTKGTVNTSMLI